MLVDRVHQVHAEALDSVQAMSGPTTMGWLESAELKLTTLESMCCDLGLFRRDGPDANRRRVRVPRRPRRGQVVARRLQVVSARLQLDPEPPEAVRPRGFVPRGRVGLPDPSWYTCCCIIIASCWSIASF